MARFGLCVFLIGSLLSLIALPWVERSWWSVFRRSVSIAAALSLWLCIARFERRSWRSYGLPAWREGKRALRFGVLLGSATLLVTLGIGLFSGVCQLDVTPDREKLWRTLLLFIPGAALVGLLEELVFRGFLLQHLLPCSKLTAIAVSSACYALVHLKTATLTLLSGLELVGLFLLGGVLALSALATGHLYLAMGLHAALAYGARVNKLLIAIPDSPISWLVGTSRLINGVASWIILLGLGAIILRWAHATSEGGLKHGHT